MARGKKTPPEVVYQIMTSWAVTDNFNESARELNLPITTIKKVVDENKDKPEFVELCTQKRKEFSVAASRVIKKTLERLEHDIDDEEKSIPVNHLTTVIGTLIDKKLLVEGKATENVAVEVKLPEGIEEYAG